MQHRGLKALGKLIYATRPKQDPENISQSEENIMNPSIEGNFIHKASLTSTCTTINIVRALVSILWIDGPNDLAISTQIIDFRESFLYHIKSLRVGIDIVSGGDRQIIFSLLDSLCEHRHQTPQNSLVSKFLLDSSSSRKLRLDMVWKMICGENTTLQSRICGLNEIRNRISDAVQELEEAKRRVEESDLQEQEKIGHMKEHISTPIIMDDAKIQSIPRLEIPSRSTTNSPSNSADDNLSTTAYAHSSCAGDDENSRQDEDQEDDAKWLKLNQVDGTPSTSHVCENDDYSFNQYNNDYINDVNNLKDSTASTELYLDRQEPAQESSFENFLLESAEREITHLIFYLSKEHSFLSTLLSPSYLHPELLKRFIVIPSFLAEQGEFTSDDIIAIWNAAMTSSHESIQHAVYELLIGLLDKLEKDHLITLGLLLETMEYDLVTEKYLLLVHQFATASLGLMKEDNREKIPLGVDLLWNLGQASF